MANKGFPVSVSQNYTLQTLIEEEGSLDDKSVFSVVSGTVTDGQNILSGRYSTPAGKIALVNNVYATVAGDAVHSITIRRNTTFNNNLPFLSPDKYVGGNDSNIFNNVALPEFAYINFSASNRGTVRAGVTAGANIKSMSGDMNFNAPYLLLQFCDSQGYSNGGNVGGGTVPNSGLGFYSRRITEQLKKEGINIRHQVKDYPGIKLTEWLVILLQGDYDNLIRKANIIFIEFGANDAVLGNAAFTNYSANLQIAIDYCLNCCLFNVVKPSFIISGPPGSSSTDRAANLQSYRDAIPPLIALSKYANYDLHFFDRLIPIPTPTVANDPLFTETALGSQLHQRIDTGHLAEYNSAMPIVRQTDFYINTPKVLLNP